MRPALFSYLKRCLAVVVPNLLTCTTEQKDPSTTLLVGGEEKGSVGAGEERGNGEPNFGSDGVQLQKQS